MNADSLWRRAAAFALDALVVLFVLWALVVVQVLWFMDDLSRRVAPAPWGERFAATVAYVVLYSAYQIVFLVGNSGRTPAREHFGVQVVDRRPGRVSSTPGIRSSALRTLSVVPLWMMPSFNAAVGLLLLSSLLLVPVAFGRAARSLPDLIAGTGVERFARPLEAATVTRKEALEAAAPPTAFTLLIGRKNARRFARGADTSTPVRRPADRR